jgi:hypothetical protein
LDQHNELAKKTDAENAARDVNQASLREIRKARLENQTSFWAKFGVTQSRGSRFEMGTEIPQPVSILLNLYLNGVISDNDLDEAITSEHTDPVAQPGRGSHGAQAG